MPQALPVKLSATPGQFKLRGCKDKRRPNGWRIDVAYGEGVPAAAAQFLQAQIVQPRWTLLQAVGMETEQRSLLDELENRGYDIASLRLSVFTLESNQRQPERLSVPSQRPGYLKARWGRLDYEDSGDFISTWGLPATRRDSSMLQGFFSSASYERGASVEATQLGSLFSMTLLQQLGNQGFDIKTLKFTVRHKDAPR